MKAIGLKIFKCEEGEEVTIEFSPNPKDCVGVIEYVFDRQTTTRTRVKNNKLSFTIKKEVTVLDIWFFFDPDQEDGLCNITLSGSNGGNFPDLVRFSEIPPIVTFTFST